MEEDFDFSSLIEEANEDITADVTPTVTTPEEASQIPDDTVLRFSGAPWFEEIQKYTFIIGGCGGIGSHLAFQLSRMKPKSMFLYDPDKVEAVNMAGQLFSVLDIHKTKVNCIEAFCRKYSDMYNIMTYSRKITEGMLFSTGTPITLFSCFDNMKARKCMYQNWLTSKEKFPDTDTILIDGRLSFDTLQVFFVDGNNHERYRDEYLFSDEEADATVCSRKQTTYMAAMIAAFMVNVLTLYLTNKTIEDKELRIPVPLLTEYDSSLMNFKTIN